MGVAGDKNLPSEMEKLKPTLEEEKRVETGVHPPKTKQAILQDIHRNLAVLSTVFFFTYTAYISTENLQSSLNFEAGLGLVSVSIIYGSFTIFGFLAAPAVIMTLTPKWALTIAFFGHTFFICANFYPRWYTLSVSSTLVGFGAAVYWVAQGVIVTQLAIQYCAITRDHLEPIISRFNGIFYTVFACTKMTGNLMSSVILQRKAWALDDVDVSLNQTVTNHISMTSSSYNASYQVYHLPLYYNTSSDDRVDIVRDHPSPNVTPAYRDVGICGSNHCPYMEHHISILQRPPQQLVYLLMGVFLACNAVGIVTTLLLKDTAGTTKRSCRHTKKPSLQARLLSTFSLFRDWRLLLLIPFYMIPGMMLSMTHGTYTQSFVSCVLGVKWVGYVMMCHGACYLVACFIIGTMARGVHRAVHFTLAVGFHLTVVLVCLLWHPSPDHLWVFFLVSGMAGFADGTWRVKLTPLTGSLFTDHQEAAFAHFNFWDALGQCFMFGISNYLCFKIKACFLIVALCLASISYVVLEVKLKAHEQQALVRKEKVCSNGQLDATEVVSSNVPLDAAVATTPLRMDSCVQTDEVL